MGNHQFGFAHHRPPEFLGKGWTYVKEKRKSTKEKKTNSTALSTENELQRTSSSWSFLKVRQNDDTHLHVHEESQDPETAFQTLHAHSSTGTPQKCVSRNPSVKRTRSMRCSPTVPDSLTLTLGVVNNVMLGASGVAASAVNAVNPNAVANALDALQKLTPAAPQLFKEPSFDEFFEEAERRNQTMEVLQAAFTPPNSSVSTGGQNSSPTSRLELESVLDRASPITVQPPTPPSTPRRSPTPRCMLSSLGGSRSKECTDDEEDSVLPRSRKNSDALSIRSGATQTGRVLIIVGGCSDVESLDGNDRQHPTIIVQPESLYPPHVSSSSSSLSAPLSSGSGISPRSGRRGSLSPLGSISSNTPLAVRFADEVQSTVVEEKQISTAQRQASSRRVKNRSSLRRKTIGGITSEEKLEMDKAASVSGRAADDTATGALATTLASQSISQKSKSPSQRSLAKSREVFKSPPSVISLLTQPQIVLIRQLWQQLYISKGPTVLGNHIFQRVMFKNAQVREVFRNADVGNQYFNVDVMCKSHAKAVANVLDDVVRNLDNLDAVESKLMDVGRQHAVFHDLGFHLNFWSVFAEAFIDCTLEWGEKNRRVEEARKAWAIIVSFITDKMKLGYQEARRTSLPQRSATRRCRVSGETDSGNTTTLAMPLVRSDSH